MPWWRAMTRSQNILLTGATGFVGGHVLRTLLAAGHTVRAASRKTLPARAGLEPRNIGNLAAPVDWAPLLEGIDVVIHAAAVSDSRGGSDLDAVNHRASADLAQAMARAGLARLVLLSSVRAQSGPSRQGILTEQDPPDPAGAYGRAKLEAETAIRGHLPQAVILRPVAVYGPNAGGVLGKLAALARKPLPLPLASLRRPRSLLAADNLAALIGQAVERPALDGQTLLVADETPVSLAELVTLMRAALGRPPGLMSVPPATLAFALRALGGSTIAERLEEGLVVSTSRLRELGITLPCSTEQAVRDWMTRP
jgi:UDP-glucose 4-epimerase